MRFKLSTYTSLFSLMVGMSSHLPAVQDQHLAELYERRANTLRKESGSEQISEPQKNSPISKTHEEEDFSLTKSKNALFTACLKKDKEAQNRTLASLEKAVTDRVNEDDSDLFEFLYRLYTRTAPIPILNSAVDNSQTNEPSKKVGELLDHGYKMEWAWALWERSKTITSHLTRDHYLAANRGQPEALNLVQKHSTYKIGDAKKCWNEIVAACNVQKLSKIAKTINDAIDQYIKHWSHIGYAQPLKDLHQLIEDYEQANQSNKKNNLIPHLSQLNENLESAAAELGDLASQKKIGYKLYNEGLKSYDEDDYSDGISKLRKATQLNTSPDTIWLGSCLQTLGHCFHYLNDLATAELCYRKSFKSGFVQAEYDLGDLYKTQGNFKQAERWYRKSISHGDIDSMISLGLMFFNRNQDNDRVQAYTLLREAADKESAQAMYHLGQFYEIEKNFDEAIIWFRKAAEKEYSGSLSNLATLLMNRGSDDDEAEKWFRKDAESNRPTQLFNLGQFLHSHGKEEEAILWYKLAAEKGSIDALNNLGCLYFDKNQFKEASGWYKKAASKGDVIATYNLALLLCEFEDSDENTIKDLLYSAAFKDYVPAMVLLGGSYLDPDNRDIKEATFWLEKAAAMGDTSAKELLETSKKVIEFESEPTSTSNGSSSPQEELGKSEIEDSENQSQAELDQKIDEIFEKLENPTPQMSVFSQEETVFNDKEDKASFSGDELNYKNSNQKTESDLSVNSNSEETFNEYDTSAIKQKENNSNSKLIENPKTRRQKARELGLALKKKEDSKENRISTIGPKASLFYEKIIKRDWDKITQNDLNTLFSDPYFNGEVILKETKSGFAIVAHIIDMQWHCTTGTHKKHGIEKYTSLIHPEVLKDVRDILEKFEEWHKMPQVQNSKS